MNSPLSILRKSPISALALAAALSVAQLSAAHAQAPKQTGTQYEPSVGQEGKDVVWVPTPQSLVDKMLDLANVTAKDVVFDLGSGDGRTVITAAKRGAKATGIEYNPDLVKLAQRNAAKEGVGGRASFRRADIFKTDFSRADVVTLYLYPQVNRKLEPMLRKTLKSGSRIVSHDFKIGEWAPDRMERVRDERGNDHVLYLWTIKK